MVHNADLGLPVMLLTSNRLKGKQTRERHSHFLPYMESSVFACVEVSFALHGTVICGHF